MKLRKMVQLIEKSGEMMPRASKPKEVRLRQAEGLFLFDSATGWDYAHSGAVLRGFFLPCRVYRSFKKLFRKVQLPKAKSIQKVLDRKGVQCTYHKVECLPSRHVYVALADREAVILFAAPKKNRAKIHELLARSPQE